MPTARTLCGALVAMLALAACGTTASDTVVVRVGEQSITKAELEHWTIVEAIRSYDNSPTGPIPKGIIPDAPNYPNCIAYLAKTAPGASTSQLRSQCRQRYLVLQHHMLDILITYDWLNDEAVDKHLTVSEAQVTRQLRHLYPTEASLHQFLTLTDETEAEERLVIRRSLLETAIQQASESKAARRRTAEEKLRASIDIFRTLIRRWVPRTTCSSGYIVPQCKEYRGPGEGVTF